MKGSVILSIYQCDSPTFGIWTYCQLQGDLTVRSSQNMCSWESDTLCCLFLSHTRNSWTEKGKMGGRRCIGPYTGQRGECTRSNQSCLGGGQCYAPKKGCSQKANALQHFQNTLLFPQISLSQLKCTYLPSEKQKKYFEESPWFTSALSGITRALKKTKKTTTKNMETKQLTTGIWTSG